MQKQIARLHYITQDLPHRSHAEQAELACKGGVGWVQLRSKNLDRQTWLENALETQGVCNKHGAKLIINDAVWLAKEIKAEGVHIGKNDMPLREAQEILDKNQIIGCTANTLDDILALSKLQPDYIGLGPFRFTSTKQNLSPVLGLEGYRHILAEMKKRAIEIPLIGIGGVMSDDIEALLKAGLWGAAVSSAINLADKPTEAAQAFIKRFQRN